MVHDPGKHRRRSIRLPGYDYGQAGAYFVTICTQHRTCLFGDVLDRAMRLNALGHTVQAVWDALPIHYPHVYLDAFVVMPNHVHGIIALLDESAVGADFKSAPTETRHSLPEIVRAFKTFSARRINERSNTVGQPVWQRNYYEHVIRDEPSLSRIRQYIAENPARWPVDRENPTALTPEPENVWRI